jgi:hypothetical protein
VVGAGLSALARNLSVPYPIVLDHPRQPHSRRLDVRGVMINYHGCMAVELYAGIPVNDYPAALAWYEKLFGYSPTFVPHDTEAVWDLDEHRSVYIVQRPEYAGHAMHTIFVDDLDALVAQIADHPQLRVSLVSKPSPFDGRHGPQGHSLPRSRGAVDAEDNLDGLACLLARYRRLAALPEGREDIA